MILTIARRLTALAQFVALLLSPATLACAGANAQSNKSEVSPETRKHVRQAIAATGLILVRSAGDEGGLRPRGSAVLVRGDGVAATNLHVITDSRSGKLYDEIVLSLASGESEALVNRYRARAVIIDRESDLALIQTQADESGNPISKSFTFPTVEIGDSKSIQLLEDLFIIGFPEQGGSTVTVNRGVVEGKDELQKWIKTDARLIHGNSGGAAVNSQGKLIGIPTKVVADRQPIDRDGDGFPDGYRELGAVGFLRPSHLVVAMLARLGTDASDRNPGLSMAPAQVQPGVSTAVSGIVKSRSTQKPIAGALVGLVPTGATVSAATLLAWGSTNGDGEFKLNNPVPPGRYTLRAKAQGYKTYTAEVDISVSASSLLVEM